MNPSPSHRRYGVAVALVLTALAAGLRNTLAGPKGWMPLDQSIVFDGAWRLLQGQRPGLDFESPAGLAPMLLQALVFRLGRVDWTHYVLHASILNALFALCVTGYALRRGFGAATATLFGLSAGVLLYPATGSPFLDQHTLAFSLIALLFLWPASPSGKAARPTGPALFVAGLAVVLAMGSKPSPWALLAALAFTAELLRRRDRPALLILILILPLPFALGALAGLGVADTGAALASFPGGLAHERLRALATPTTLAGRVPAAMLISLGLATVGVIGSLFAGALRRSAAIFGTGLRGGALLGAGLVFLVVTNNQAEGLLGFVPVLPLFLLQTPSPSASRLGRALPVVVLAVLVGETLHFDRTQVASRRGLDFHWEAAEATAVREGPLSGLKWRTNAHWHQNPEGFARAARYLAEAEGSFWLIGDMTPLYAAAGHVSPVPMIWLHPGWTHPRRDDPARPPWEESLLRRLESAGVRRVVIEGQRTWNGESFRDFPIIYGAWSKRAKPPIAIGGFVIIEIAESESGSR